MSTTMKRLAVGMGANDAVANALDVAAARWGIADPFDQCRFLAQCFVESGGFKVREENLNYRAPRLLEIFKGRNGLSTLKQAQEICAGGKQAIANFVYGGAWGARNLGNTEPGDGWKFRGRGLIQLTGRANYARTSKGCYGSDKLINEPDWLVTTAGAADSAAYFWYANKLNGITDIKALTRRINPGLLELGKRIDMTRKAVDLLKSLS